MLAKELREVYGSPRCSPTNGAAMLIPHNPNPLHVASHAERLAKEQVGNRLGLVFSAITAISLGVMTTKMILDILRDKQEHRAGSGHQRR
jgi:hypothetical protein